jgi:DNA-directed RNA polymerase sigma subunit (sigma70/sigma32)
MNQLDFSIPSSQPDDRPEADEIVLGQIRVEAVTEAFALTEASDPLLAEILRRRRGLGGAPQETVREIATSMNCSRSRVRGLDRCALELFRVQIMGHRHIALLPAQGAHRMAPSGMTVVG